MPIQFSSREANVEILPGRDDSENNWPRIEACYVGDVSGSMRQYLKEVLGSFGNMVDSVAEHPAARQRVELACAMFASDVVMQSFAPLSFYAKKKLKFDCGGRTSLGAALDAVIEETSRRRQALLARGVECSDSFCVVFTDGAYTDDIKAVLPKIRQAEATGEIEFVPVAPDEDSVERLAEIFEQEAVLLANLDFDLLFSALARSLRTCSQGQARQSQSFADLVNQEIERNASDFDSPDEQDVLPAPKSLLRLPGKEE
ncbi:VWA domain-containing protein [Pirellulales bacterium]|nr:VWA domain-containing protein [Pirellulales bacterium]